MKKILLAFVIILLFSMPIGAAQSASIGAQNTFTTGILVPDTGYLSLSISGTWSATVTLQRRFNISGTWGSWMDVETFSANTEKIIANPMLVNQVQYRAGVKTGDYSSGTVVITIAE